MGGRAQGAIPLYFGLQILIGLAKDGETLKSMGGSGDGAGNYQCRRRSSELRLAPWGRGKADNLFPAVCRGERVQGAIPLHFGLQILIGLVKDGETLKSMGGSGNGVG